jgi:arylsulfatase A-like enzyme
MPLLIRYPGRTHPGSVSDAMILNVDFAPTLLTAAGLSAPSALQGRSFLPLLAAPAPDDWRTSMYYRYYHYPGDHQVQPHYGVRTGRHKLIFFNRLNQWELYDLKTDPQELRNVYADPAFAAVREALKAELFRLRKELDDHDQFQERQN